MYQDLLSECRNVDLIKRDPMALNRLGRRIARAVKAGAFNGSRIRVAVLSSFLSDMLTDALLVALLARNIPAEIVKGPYGAIAVDLLSDKTITRECDLVLILPSHRDLAYAPPFACSRLEADAAVDRDAAFWISLWDSIASPVVQLSFDPPPVRALSELDGFKPGGFLRHVRQVNQKIGDAANSRVAFVDSEALATLIGADWHDPKTYQLCKQPFAPASLWEIADALAASASSVLGKSRKVLVLDLDNTLWGGVVGDVGIRGIALGKGIAAGEAFSEFQEFVKKLGARGIVLAVCSKNKEDIAREPFRSHPDMILKEEDIACFIANFEDKATNLKRIAQKLNVGLESLAFVDDSPVERAWVRQELPEVLVIELPDDPALYCQSIERARAFPMHTLTAEDLTRNDSYRARAWVQDAAGGSGDINAFLQSLSAEAKREAVSDASVERIVQLVSKTNQFKLSPTTFSAQELFDNADGVFAVRFKDRMQDYGIVAVVVVEIEGGEVVIRNWVMSCRVFSRRLEHATLELIRDFARQRDAKRIRADFYATSKNGVAKTAMIELGFSLDSDGIFAATVESSRPMLPHFIQTDWLIET